MNKEYIVSLTFHCIGENLTEEEIKQQFLEVIRRKDYKTDAWQIHEISKIRIGTYGSMKKGFHNHKWLQNAPLIGKDKILGIMQIPESYPHLFHKNEIETDEHENEHEIEIYDIDIETYKNIKQIERSAGYKEEEIETKFGIIKIFFSQPEWFNTSLKIEKEYTQKVYK